MLGFINFPSWIHPEIIQGFPIRWYGLMYLVAFAVTYFFIKLQAKQDKTNYPEEYVGNIVFYGILAMVIGARIFSALFYHPNFDGNPYTINYWAQPWLIFWPFNHGQFVGLQGMSYHGGVIGCTIGIIIYCKVVGFSIRKWGDIACVAIPAGYTFGRLGNFLNGELWGRITSSPIGMLFPNAPSLSIKNSQVADIASKLDIAPGFGGLVNLPRHPSQIYELLFEGIILFLILWFVGRKFKKYDGQLIAGYIGGYGLFRFIIEYFREPDSAFNYVLGPDRGSNEIFVFKSIFNISIGQVYCLIMIIVAIAVFVGVTIYGKKYGNATENFKIPEKNKKKSLFW